MNAPTPKPIVVTPGKKPLVVVSRFSRRDLIVVVVIVAALAGFIFLALRNLDERPKNTLSGIVPGRYATGERETLMDVSGMVIDPNTGANTMRNPRTAASPPIRVARREGPIPRGLTRETVDTGYYLKVFVPDDNRTYDVIVEKELWEQKKDGDRLDFLRPKSEQSY